MELKNIKDILNTKKVYELPKRKKDLKVYFLIKNEKVVYVGQTINIDNRLFYHKTTSTSWERKDFTHYSFIECNNKDDMDLMESVYIQVLNPIYNKSKGKTSLSKDYLINLLKKQIICD